jgi:hypothetical protein
MTLGDPPKQSPGDPATESERHQHADKESAPILRAELQVPAAAINAYEAEHQKDYRLERRKFCVEILTFVAVVAYGFVAALQWAAIRNGNEAAYRPQVGVSKLKMTDFEAGKRPVVIVSIENFGQSTTMARTVATVVVSDPNSAKLRQAEKETIKVIRSGQLPVIWVPLFPHADFFTIPASAAKGTSVEKLKDGSKVLELLVTISYSDHIGSRSHRTDFAAIYNPRTNSFEAEPGGCYAN